MACEHKFTPASNYCRNCGTHRTRGDPDPETAVEVNAGDFIKGESLEITQEMAIGAIWACRRRGCTGAIEIVLGHQEGRFMIIGKGMAPPMDDFDQPSVEEISQRIIDEKAA